MDLNKFISLATFAGIAGLLVIHFQGTTAIIDSFSKASTAYIGAIQANQGAAG